MSRKQSRGTNQKESADTTLPPTDAISSHRGDPTAPAPPPDEVEARTSDESRAIEDLMAADDARALEEALSRTPADSSEDLAANDGPVNPDNPLDAEDPEALDVAEQVESARELSITHLRGLLEALVFASDKPMKSTELARLASAPLKQVRALLEELKEHYVSRGILLDEIAGGWLFRTNAAFAPFVRELTSEKPVRLTRAQIETLAIVAYRQPITRPEVDDIRGVDSGATLKLLLERELVRILGKKDEPGRPILYGTTMAFLELFGLKSLKDLPTLKEFTELNEDSRRVADDALQDDAPPIEVSRQDANPPEDTPIEDPRALNRGDE